MNSGALEHGANEAMGRQGKEVACSPCHKADIQLLREDLCAFWITGLASESLSRGQGHAGAVCKDRLAAALVRTPFPVHRISPVKLATARRPARV